MPTPLVGSGSNRDDREKSIASAPAGFTEKQGQYLAFIYAYTCIEGRPPAEEDFRKFFRVTAPTAHNMIITLERKGLIGRTPRAARSIKILISPELIPILREPIAIPVSGY